VEGRELKMDCKRVQESLSEYSVGLITGKAFSEIETHLSSCLACQHEHEKLEKVLSLVDDLQLREPPAGLWNGVYNRISSEPKVPERMSLGQSIAALSRRPVSRWSAGLATIGLAVALVFSRSHAPTASGGYSPAEFVQGHIAYSSQDVLADQVALNSAAAMTDRDQSDNDVL